MNTKKLILPLLCLLFLGGCANSDDTLELATPDGSVRGSYVGEEVDGLPAGQGVFTSENGWVYEGSFDAGAFGTGRVTDYPAPAFGGSYTGDVAALVPQGEGTLRLEGGSFSGSFEDGLPQTGSAENFPCCIELGGESLDGLYTGPLSAALPEGEGSFTTVSSRALHYSGGFAAGCAAGEGTLSDDGFLLSGQRGRYEGSVLDGVPSGEGSFYGRSPENIDFSYVGQWKNGLYHGEGELLFDSALYYERRGHFSEGEFTPEPFELLAALGSREPRFSLSADTEAYVSEYPELLDPSREVPHYMVGDYRFLRENSFNYINYVEDPAAHAESWLLFYNYIILQKREIDVFGTDNRCTVYLASNTLYKEPAVFILFGDAPTLSNARYVSAYGIPLGMTHYTSATGEEVEAVVALLGSAGGY